MKIHAGILPVILAAAVLCLPVSAGAEDQSAEVNSLKMTVEMKLEKLKTSSYQDIARDEIKAIESYLETTGTLVKEEEYEKAYYVISIAMVYFNLIEAKRDFKNSEKELLDIKSKVDK